jgi:hypothetical protein
VAEAMAHVSPPRSPRAIGHMSIIIIKRGRSVIDEEE